MVIGADISAMQGKGEAPRLLTAYHQLRVGKVRKPGITLQGTLQALIQKRCCAGQLLQQGSFVRGVDCPRAQDQAYQCPRCPRFAHAMADVPAGRISHMPWLASEPSTPGSARQGNAPAGRTSRAPWLPSEPSTPTVVRPMRRSLQLLLHWRMPNSELPPPVPSPALHQCQLLYILSCPTIVVAHSGPRLGSKCAVVCEPLHPCSPSRIAAVQPCHSAVPGVHGISERDQATS